MNRRRSIAVSTCGLLLFSIPLGCSCSQDPPRPELNIALPNKAAARATLEYSGWGTLRGKVTFDGEPPTVKIIDPGLHRHKDYCIGAGLRDDTWLVHPRSLGVANVVVALKAPAGTCFPQVPEEKKFWPDTVVIDQPHCVFAPRVVTMFPERYNPEQDRLVRTGQRLIVRNSSDTVRHGAELEGSNTLNPRITEYLDPKPEGGKAFETVFRPHVDPRPLTLRCDYHPWMKAYVWAFDHPFSAVTDASGQFEIKLVPAGVDLELFLWHEAGTILVRGKEKPSKVIVRIPDQQVLELELIARQRIE